MNKKNEILEKIDTLQSLPFNAQSLKTYVQNLADLLSKGSIVKQKSFFRSFIKRIVVNHPEAEILYNIPIINNKGRTSKSEVLPMLQIGSPIEVHSNIIIPLIIPNTIHQSKRKNL